MSSLSTSEPRPLSEQLGRAWNAFWFVPTNARGLAVIRIATAALGLLLWASYANDLQQWFGPEGVVSPSVIDSWRSSYGISLFDSATTAASLWALYAVGFVAFAALLVGIGTPFAAIAAAVLWVSLLHRGPMLVQPADDLLVILLWCLVIGRSGDAISLDARLRAIRKLPEAGPSVRNRLALSLLGVHASGIAVAAILSQLKGDVWWDGTAAWWLVSGRDQAAGTLMAALAESDYLTNFVTHAITLFEIVFAAGVWVAGLRGFVVTMGLFGWPLIGLLSGDLLWGCGMATLGLAWAPPAWFAGRPALFAGR